MVNSQKLKFNKKKFLSNLLENQWDKEIKKVGVIVMIDINGFNI